MSGSPSSREATSRIALRLKPNPGSGRRPNQIFGRAYQADAPGSSYLRSGAELRRPRVFKCVPAPLSSPLGGASYERTMTTSIAASDVLRSSVVKRAADLSVACALLAFTLPLMMMVLLAIKLDSSGPVFYPQERVGLGGRRFTLLKLRSMRQDAEADGRPVWAAAQDDRITRVGRFICCMRIDELPQLFNVLRGEMSMVGPRPERPHFVDQLGAIIPSYHDRHTVLPGITGWAQISYPYGASIEDARQKLRYDLDYIANHRLVLDLKILVATVGVVIGRIGAR
jgi:lipopolysaccharide/colanic/teichoic acid biosynthesis glycosyltransferase